MCPQFAVVQGVGGIRAEGERQTEHRCPVGKESGIGTNNQFDRHSRCASWTIKSGPIPAGSPGVITTRWVLTISCSGF